MSSSQIRNFSTTPLISLTTDDLVYMHIGGRSYEKTSDFTVISCLETIEQNMRHTKTYDKSKIFAPVLCAFSILDQLGSCYGDLRSSATNKTNSILLALHHFCGIDAGSAEAEHLVAFRNGMMHDSSMTNYKYDNRKNIIGYYIFRYDENGPVVAPSVATWNGSYSDIRPDTTSYINRDKLVDMTSDAIKK